MTTRQPDRDPIAGLRADRRLLLAILILALAQGLVRVAVVPLWRHYDEPAHFEYVRFLLEHHRVPEPADVDRTILDHIAATDRGIVPCPEPVPRPPRSCVRASSVFDEAPGYYLLQAAVQRLAGPRTIDGQVRLARLVSVLLSVVVVGLAFHATRQLLPREPSLALGVAGLLAVQPGYVDLASALNNDVGAVAALSLLFWSGTSLICRGVAPVRLAVLAAAAGLGLAAKSTAWIGVPLGAAAVWLAVWPRLWPWVRWGVPCLVGLAALLLAVDGAWPAQWFPYGRYPTPRRIATSAPWGRYVFSAPFASKPGPTLWQPLPAEIVPPGHPLTLGAWVRAPRGTQPVPLPVLGVEGRPLDDRQVEAGLAWTFHAYAVTAPLGGPLALYVPEVEAGIAQYDGIVLAVGRFPVDSSPRFDDADAGSGIWGNARFVNLIANASAERGWPAVRGVVDRRLPVGGLNYRLPSALDWRRTWPAYWAAIRWQFVTYWTGFGTGVAEGPRGVRVAFALLTVVAVLGVLTGAQRVVGERRMASPSWRGLALAALTVLAAGVMNLLRIDPVDAVGRHVPTARYAYVAIVPAMLLLAVGWSACWPARHRAVALAGLGAAMLGVGVWLFLTVQLPWYQGR